MDGVGAGIQRPLRLRPQRSFPRCIGGRLHFWRDCRGTKFIHNGRRLPARPPLPERHMAKASPGLGGLFGRDIREWEEEKEAKGRLDVEWLPLPVPPQRRYHGELHARHRR